MKKITLLLIAALALGIGSTNAQSQKFRKSNVGKAKTEVKAEAKTEAKAEAKTFKKSEAKSASVTAAPKKTSATAVEKQTTATKKQAGTAKKATVQAASVDKSNFNGVFTNTYSDGLGGTSTHLLTVEFDEATGTVKGLHTNESGVERTYHGRLVGNTLVCVYDEDGDEFAEMILYDANTIKLEGFTGTFKRNDGTTNLSTSPTGQTSAAAVDRAGYEAIKQYIKEKEEEK